MKEIHTPIDFSVRYISQSPPLTSSAQHLFADKYDDDDGTYIKTMRHSSGIICNLGQYTRTITHNATFLAEITINGGYEVFGVLLKRMEYQMDPRIYVYNCSYMTQTDLPED